MIRNRYRSITECPPHRLLALRFLSTRFHLLLEGTLGRLATLQLQTIISRTLRLTPRRLARLPLGPLTLSPRQLFAICLVRVIVRSGRRHERAFNWTPRRLQGGLLPL